MQRHVQSLDNLKLKLSVVETEWRDAFADRVIREIEAIQLKEVVSIKDIELLIAKDYDVAITIFQLIAGVSKDDYRNLEPIWI